MIDTDKLELVPIILFELAQENKLPFNKWLATRLKNLCLNVIGYYFRTISNTAITKYLQSDYFNAIYKDIDSLTDYREYTLDLLAKFSYEFSTKYGDIKTAVSVEIKELFDDLEGQLSPIEYTVFMSTYMEKYKRYQWHW